MRKVWRRIMDMLFGRNVNAKPEPKPDTRQAELEKLEAMARVEALQLRVDAIQRRAGGET